MACSFWESKKKRREKEDGLFLLEKQSKAFETIEM